MTADRTGPVFVVGVGRSGSTMFHRVLCRHPHAAYLTAFLERHPQRVWWNRMIMRALDLPLAGPVMMRANHPTECYSLWDRLYVGFSAPCRDLVADDVTNSAREAVRETIARTLTSRRRRLAAKLTGWPRIGFLREIFPDARFIHVLRDGRPVAASFLRMGFWQGWRGSTSWQWGPLDQRYEEEWQSHDRSFVALAGIQWKLLMDAMEDAKRHVPSEVVVDIRYEDLCADPVGQFRLATEFAGLPWVPSFERALRRERFRNENEKWRSDLTERQQAVLESVLAGHLSRFGYRSHTAVSGSVGAAAD